MSGVSVRCSLGANTAVVDKCSICSSMDAFIRKLYDRPFNGKYVLIQRLGKVASAFLSWYALRLCL